MKQQRTLIGQRLKHIPTAAKKQNTINIPHAWDGRKSVYGHKKAMHVTKNRTLLKKYRCRNQNLNRRCSNKTSWFFTKFINSRQFFRISFTLVQWRYCECECRQFPVLNVFLDLESSQKTSMSFPTIRNDQLWIILLCIKWKLAINRNLIINKNFSNLMNFDDNANTQQPTLIFFDCRRIRVFINIWYFSALRFHLKNKTD